MSTSVWHPAFLCPVCGSSVDADAAGALKCVRCTAPLACRGGIYRALPAGRLAEAEPFLRQYRVVRERDGYRSGSGDYYRALPAVEPGHRQASSWRVRRDSYQTLCRLLRRHARGPLTILDLGAGNGWLSYRLAALDHRAVAVDWLDDEEDGLGACVHYGRQFVRVQADFNRPIFADRQFDAVIFNGSLHYAADPAASLAIASATLVRGGIIVVMDSPMFHHDEDGRAMLARKEALFQQEYGLDRVVSTGAGYLTLRALAEAVEPLHLHWRFLASRGGLRWATGRWVARMKIGREPAGFGVWMAR